MPHVARGAAGHARTHARTTYMSRRQYSNASTQNAGVREDGVCGTAGPVRGGGRAGGPGG